MSTRIYLACDERGRLLAFTLTSEQVSDFIWFEQVMAAIRSRALVVGILSKHPDHVIADKGYDSQGIRGYLRRRGISHTIPQRRHPL